MSDVFSHYRRLKNPFEVTVIYTRVFAQVKPDDAVISPISALRFIPLSLRSTTSTPQDTGFATPSVFA